MQVARYIKLFHADSGKPIKSMRSLSLIGLGIFVINVGFVLTALANPVTVQQALPPTSLAHATLTKGEIVSLGQGDMPQTQQPSPDRPDMHAPSPEVISESNTSPVTPSAESQPSASESAPDMEQSDTMADDNPEKSAANTETSPIDDQSNAAMDEGARETDVAANAPAPTERNDAAAPPSMAHATLPQNEVSAAEQDQQNTDAPTTNNGEKKETKEQLDQPLQPSSVGNSANLDPAVVDSWTEKVEILERENIALRDRLTLKEGDKLSDIKVDAVAQIHENVLRDRVAELEKELDKLHMQGDPGNASEQPPKTDDMTNAVKGAIPPPPPAGKAGEPPAP